jgi:hypothetical protein
MSLDVALDFELDKSAELHRAILEAVEDTKRISELYKNKFALKDSDLIDQIYFSEYLQKLSELQEGENIEDVIHRHLIEEQARKNDFVVVEEKPPTLKLFRRRRDDGEDAATNLQNATEMKTRGVRVDIENAKSAAKHSRLLKEAHDLYLASVEVGAAEQESDLEGDYSEESSSSSEDDDDDSRPENAGEVEEGNYDQQAWEQGSEEQSN